MTAAAVVPSAPAPDVTEALAEAALTVFAGPVEAGPGEVDALADLAHEPVDGPLRRWAERIATAEGFPLIGVGLSAPVYPALLWNGARLDAVAPEIHWAPLLAALATADPQDAEGLDRVARALAAAEIVRRSAVRLLADGASPVARPTLSTMAAAAAAHLAVEREAEGDPAALAGVLDLAASLTVLTPGEARSPVSGLWAGHSAASGWLAARLPAVAVTAMAGSVVHTLSAAAGRAIPAGTERATSLADLGARLR